MMCPFFVILIFIGVQLICNVVLLSAVPESQSDTQIHISTPFYLLRNLYAGQEATFRTGHETTD